MKFINNSNDLAKLLNIKIAKDIKISNVSTDTRDLKPESLFFAIKGEKFNGNDYVENAIKKGACLVITDSKRFKGSNKKRIIYVNNTVVSLRKIAKNILKSFEGNVIGITGSNGKTTTTKIISSVLNKSSGISVQGGTKSKKNLVDIFSKSKIFQNSKPFSVHRLDKDTSGVFLIAKHRQSAQLLTSLFRLRKVHKTYLAICHGEIAKDHGEWKNNLKHGQGTYTHFNGSIKKGIWDKGSLKYAQKVTPPAVVRNKFHYAQEITPKIITKKP